VKSIKNHMMSGKAYQALDNGRSIACLPNNRVSEF